MFLLNQLSVQLVCMIQLPLHSTMFLLNPDAGEAVRIYPGFTFHDVSIKSGAALRGNLQPEKTLHSTMFLLNRKKLQF